MYDVLKDLAPDFAVRSAIYPMERLGKELGLNRLYVKRDDLTDFYGNKTRHAKYLVAYFRYKGVRAVELIGRGDSDCMRMYGQAFKRVGIDLKYTLNSDPALGNGWVIKRLNQYGDDHVELKYCDLKDVAALGYVEAVEELEEQMPEVEHIYMYSYDATWIGVSIGCWLNLLQPRIVAVRGQGAPHGALNTPGDKKYINDVYSKTEELVGCKVANRRADLRESAGRWHHKMVNEILNVEGILLDPVYTSKAMIELIKDARAGKIGKDDRVLFWHTGGIFLNW